MVQRAQTRGETPAAVAGRCSSATTTVELCCTVRPLSEMAASIHSSELQWQLLRTGHSFLVKRSGAVFSAEPLNLTNTHSAKFSGLGQRKGKSDHDGGTE